MSNNERKSCMVTTVSIKDSECYIDMDGIQWRQTGYTNVYSICIEYTVYKMYTRGGDDYIRG